MAKNEISVKSNGLRNELKSIRKSIDNLTNVIQEIGLVLHQPTNKHEKNCTDCTADGNVLCRCKKRKTTG